MPSVNNFYSLIYLVKTVEKKMKTFNFYFFFCRENGAYISVFLETRISGCNI